MIRIENLSKSFGDLQVLKGVDAEIARGECVAIIGPSGTGKSVFLTCLNALTTPDSGHVWIDGVDIYDRATDINKVRADMGMVYQQFNLFSHMNVLENIVLAPMKLRGLRRDEAEAKAVELLDLVSLRGKVHAMPGEMSGGQQQRIAIARALAMEPKLMLLDEPTSALDPTMVGEVLSVIRALAKRDMTMLIVTHEMEFARDVASRILYMDECGIYEQGTPEEIFERPRRPRTQAFVRKLKTLEATIDREAFDLLGFMSQVELFCAKYAIEARKARRIQLVIEELSANLLARPGVEAIDLVVEYAERDHLVRLLMDYGSAPLDPFDEDEETPDDMLGMMIVRGMTTGVRHAFDGTNRLEIDL